ncbi:hypothetical protein [Longimicrobium terrae]|nr:hypothetical protein [Longimicrobium terrae]
MTGRYLRIAFVLAIALPFSARDGRAQAAGSAAATRTVREICPAAEARIATRDGERMDGCRAVTDARLLLTAPLAGSQVPPDAVDSLRIQGSSDPETTLLLASVFAGVGLLVDPGYSGRGACRKESAAPTGSGSSREPPVRSWAPSASGTWVRSSATCWA